MSTHSPEVTLSTEHEDFTWLKPWLEMRDLETVTILSPALKRVWLPPSEAAAVSRIAEDRDRGAA
eukprot:CAMPEP_0118946872 /NCGR_PEP_ID=MMETSP1169-20130426/45019_1 /TAXON_ID=36882 /ORGANISM="Pyramimonas obovata, Strain CCMP722" /LENGTH=64 /DNA_ID=CAMNT_0006892967 /DNA_START=195 /DNA_END=386 /DNA_ORIENTATION=+